MTNQEAIKTLFTIHMDKAGNFLPIRWHKGIEKDYRKALDMAIEALEQEPCEDAISRKAVSDGLFECPMFDFEESNGFYYDSYDVDKMLKDIPSVRSQAVDWDGMIEEIKERTIAMVAAEDDTLDVQCGLFEEDILEIISKYRKK